MAKYTEKSTNIIFGSVPTSNFMEVGVLLSHPDLKDATDADLTDIADDNGGRLPSKVNAVEIDWNGAQVAGKTLNTTGEVLSMLKDAYNNANEAHSSLSTFATKKELTEAIGNVDFSTLATKEELSSFSTYVDYKFNNSNYITGSSLSSALHDTKAYVAAYYTTKSEFNEVSDKVNSLGYYYVSHSALNTALNNTVKSVNGQTGVVTIPVVSKTVEEGLITWTQIQQLVETIDSLKLTVSALTDRVHILEENGKEIEVTAIAINGGNVTLYGKNDTVDLSATITPNNATSQTLTWTVNDTSYATISSTGTGARVTAQKIGSVTVTATSTNGVKGTKTLTVAEARITGISFNQESLTIAYHDYSDFTIPALPVTITTNANDGALFSSDLTYYTRGTNADYFTVNAGTGSIRYSYPGQCELQAWHDSTLSTYAKCIINVTNSKQNAKFVDSGKTTFDTTRTYGDASFNISILSDSRGAYWDPIQSSYSNVATVDANGKVTINGAGKTVFGTYVDSNIPYYDREFVTVEMNVAKANAALELNDDYLEITTFNNTIGSYPTEIYVTPAHGREITYYGEAIDKGYINLVQSDGGAFFWAYGLTPCSNSKFTIEALESNNYNSSKLEFSVTVLNPSKQTLSMSITDDSTGGASFSNNVGTCYVGQSFDWNFNNVADREMTYYGTAIDNGIVEIDYSKTGNYATVKTLKSGSGKITFKALESKTYKETTLDVTVNVNEPVSATKYYWYAGQTDPTTMTSISPVVDDNTSPGWREIGTEIPNYSSSNMLYNPNVATIVTGTSLQYNYIAIPSKSTAIMRDGAGNPGTSVNLCTLIGTKTLGNVEYNIYKTSSKAKKIGYPIY